MPKPLTTGREVLTTGTVYKVWIEIEAYDIEAEEGQTVTMLDLPCTATFRTAEEARQFAERMHACHEHEADPPQVHHIQNALSSSSSLREAAEAEPKVELVDLTPLEAECLQKAWQAELAAIPTVDSPLVSELRRLVEKWQGYYDNSERKMAEARADGMSYEYESRRAEACTLNVCISELEAALGSQESPR